MASTTVIEARTKRAEKTIQNLASNESQAEDTQENQESVETPQIAEAPRRGRPPKKEQASLPAPQIAEGFPDRKRGPSEDFFDYLQRVTPEEWSNSQTSGLYIYKKSPKGNVRITDEPLHCPITLQELREQYLPVHGDGTYRLQFTTGLKHLSNCGENITFDANGNFLGSSPIGLLRPGSVGGMDGFTDAIRATSDMLKDGAKAAVEVSKVNQLDQNKSLDVSALITAIAGLMPKQDGNFLTTMLENQRIDAEKRAERAEREAKERSEREAKDSKDREERSEKFFALIQTQQDKAATEREKFYTMLLAEKEKKQEDTFGGLDLVKGLFKIFLEERVEGAANPAPNTAFGLLATALDKFAPAITALAPAIGAKLSGQMPQPIHIAPPLHPAPGSDGGSTIVPTPGVINTEALLMDLLNRLGLYLSTHDPATYQLDHWIDVVFEEYGPVASILQQLPKERIMEVLKSSSIGIQLLSIPNSQLFIEALIDEIKRPEENTQEGKPLAQAIPTEAQIIQTGPKKKKEVS